jgi:phosphatidylglycerol---prolipoprotein diacylglyceryl transferase
MSLLAEVHWNVPPELFQLGPFVVRWYGLCFAALFFIGYAMVRWQFRIEGKNEADLQTLLVFLVAGTIVGARLGHVLFYDPLYYFHHKLEIFKVWHGGLASHGGTAGVLVAMYLYSRSRPDQPFLWLVDRVAVPTALGAAFIRLGNLLNSEILGRPAAVPWAFVFERVDDVPRHPAQLYEMLAYLAVFGVLLMVYRYYRERTPRGLLTGLFLFLVFSARLGIEFFKEPQESFRLGLPLNLGQVLSLPFVIAGAWLIYRAMRLSSTASSPD